MKNKHLSSTAKIALDQQVDALNSDTLQGLREARETALTHHKKSPWKMAFSWKWMTGAGVGLAIASVLTFIVVPQLRPNTLSPLDDLDLLTAEVDMELVNQLEFYQWLDETFDES